MSLAKSPHISFEVSEEVGTQAEAAIGRFQMQHRDGPYWSLMSTNSPGKTWGLDVQDGWVDQVGGDIAAESGVSPEEGRSLVLEILAHRQLENDLFVSTTSALHARRIKSGGLFNRIGVVSPREAIYLIGALLRDRGDFRVDQISIIDATIYYASLARGLLPNTIAAYRHCLAPSRRGHLERASEYLEGIISRVEQLARACDLLTILSQQEGIYSAGNSLLDSELYHLQNSMVLISGAMDMLCWFVAALERVQPNPRTVDWKSLAGLKATQPKWLGTLANSDAITIRDGLRRRDLITPGLRASAEFRDTYQHRHPLRGGVAEFHDVHGLPEATATIVDVRMTLDGRAIDRMIGGVIERGEFQFILPAQFQRAAFAELVVVVERTLGLVAWDTADWWSAALPTGALADTGLDELLVNRFQLGAI